MDRVFVLWKPEMVDAQFKRRMRKTACPVVWKGHGVKSPVPPSDQERNAERICGGPASTPAGRGFKNDWASGAGAVSGVDRVGRGGGWRGIAGVCRSASRSGTAPDVRSSYLGFRPARTLP